MSFLGRTPVDTKTFVAAEDIGLQLSVALDTDGAAVVGDETGPIIGFANRLAATGDEIPVLLLSAPEITAVAGGAIGVGVAVYLAAAGKVAAAGTVAIGISTTAAAADGELINFVQSS